MAEYSFNQGKTVIQQLTNIVVSKQTSCIDLIKQTMSESMDQLGSDITK